MIVTIIGFSLVLLVVYLLYSLFRMNSRKAPARSSPLSPSRISLLEKHVAFYRNLDENNKRKFENRVADFLAAVKIEGIGTSVDEIDEVFIAASAMIPMFGFNMWHYHNLGYVLLYPQHFDERFDFSGNDKPVMGMVGEGAMNDKMILSKPALHQGFKNESDKRNTAIHEFVHLLDKMDGDIDGVPGVLLERQYTIPWLDLMHRKIAEILKGRSDINPYGGSSKTEFFAVAAEYFFERPDLLADKHPQLYKLMTEIFDQDRLK